MYFAYVKKLGKLVFHVRSLLLFELLLNNHVDFGTFKSISGFSGGRFWIG